MDEKRQEHFTDKDDKVKEPAASASTGAGAGNDELFEKIKKLIAKKLEIDEAKITMESNFRTDLGADSLDTYELVYAIEEELKVEIPDEKANEFGTVRDAYEFIKSQQE